MDDIVLPDAAADLRACVNRLIPLPRLSETIAQARIDALARRVSASPGIATTLSDAIDKFALDDHFDAAEGVIAALGRAEAGVSVLLVLLVQELLAPRLRGAAALSLVQPRAPGGDDPARRFGAAYARPPVVVSDPSISDALRRALVRSAYAKESGGIESDRLLDACAGGGGLLDAGLVRSVLRYGGERAKLRLFAVLERNEMLEPAIDEVVEDAWRGEPDRALRRAALAVLARTDGRHWDDVVQLITDPSRPGALRLDALYRLTPRPLLAENDVRTFETWIPVLAAWSEREPTIRDNEPMADARNGPNVTFVDVPTRDRVAALAQAVDRATGLESAILHDWAVRLSESIEK